MIASSGQTESIGVMYGTDRRGKLKGEDNHEKVVRTEIYMINGIDDVMGGYYRKRARFRSGKLLAKEGHIGGH